MDAAIPPAGILLGEPQDQGADGAQDPRPSRALRPGPGRMAACDQIAVPAQHRVRTHQQPHPAQHLDRHPMQQRRQERAIARGEPHLLATKLALQHRDLMAQGEDLRVLVPIAHRQHTQHRERVRHGQVSQSQQHDRQSCRGGHQSRERTNSSPRARDAAHPAHPAHQAPTRADEVFGKGSTTNRPAKVNRRRHPKPRLDQGGPGRIE